MQIPEIKQLEQGISYIVPEKEPLSANVGMIEGEHAIWIYDVGRSEYVPHMIERSAQEKARCVVLSHFHPDHIANLTKIPCEKLYQGKYTFKYTQFGTVVEQQMYCEDGKRLLHIFPMPSSHAKGSLALEVDEKYCFLGDALYPAQKGAHMVYNVQHVQEQIQILKRIKAPYVLLSHKEPFCRKKEAVLSWLEALYARRKKQEPYIRCE